METRTIIEEIIVMEFKGLCSTCVHPQNCVYFKTTTKEVIQCDQFEPEAGYHPTAIEPGGLCRSCDLSNSCKLPGRKSGVWHCNEFR